MRLFDPIIESRITGNLRLSTNNYWKIHHSRGKISSLKTSLYQTHVMDGEMRFATQVSSFLHDYTESGYIQYALSLDRDNNVLWEYFYIWDLHKKLLRCKCLTPDKKVLETYSYHFNEADELVRKRCYSPQGKLLWEERLDEPPQGGDEDPRPRIESFFNEWDDEVERREISPSGSAYIRSFEYVYDPRHNWIKKIERTQPLNNITSITQRLIEYYDD